MSDQDIVARMSEMENKFNALIAAVGELTSQVSELTTQVAETKEIVETWRSIKLWAQFGKWTAGFVAAVATSAVAFKSWWLK